MACGMLSKCSYERFLRKFQFFSHGPEFLPMDKIYHLGIVWSGGMFSICSSFRKLSITEEKEEKA